MKSVLLVRQGWRGCRCIFDPIVSMRKRLFKCRWGKDETPCRSIPYPVRTIRTFRGPRLSNQSFSGLSSPQRHFSFPWRQGPPPFPSSIHNPPLPFFFLSTQLNSLTLIIYHLHPFIIPPYSTLLLIFEFNFISTSTSTSSFQHNHHSLCVDPFANHESDSFVVVPQTSVALPSRPGQPQQAASSSFLSPQP